MLYFLDFQDLRDETKEDIKTSNGSTSVWEASPIRISKPETWSGGEAEKKSPSVRSYMRYIRSWVVALK